MLRYEKKLLMLSQRYANKDAKIGDECVCPTCGSKFIKETYQQVFCKTKEGTICKDGYWNFVDESKRNNRTRISPANALHTEIWNDNRYDEEIDEEIDDGLDYLLDRG
jgi:hypothetical protein